ncbi:MAG: hypothetical protein KC620_03105, partial [Myxococcales bacterium]|nr:hypothetical protein [Myxococcales bacterium]
FATAEVNPDNADRWTLTIDPPMPEAVPQPSCGHSAQGVVFAAQVPSDGYWIFTTDGTTTAVDTVLSSYPGCPSAQTEDQCGDDDVGFAGLVEGEMHAGQTIHLIAAAYDGELSAFNLRALRFPLAAQGEPCGLDAGQFCAGDLVCIVNPENRAQGLCETPSAPELLEASAWRQSNDVVSIRAHGRDASRDVIAFVMELFDADDEVIVIDVGTGDTELFVAPNNDVGGLEDFVAEVRVGGFDNFPEAVGMSLRLLDTTDQTSEAMDLRFDPIPRPQAGDACDPGQVASVCAMGLVCDSGAETCEAAGPPVLTAARFYLNTVDGTLGVEMDGTDPNADLLVFRIGLTDANGALLRVGDQQFLQVPVTGLVAYDGDNWHLRYSGLVPAGVDAAAIANAQAVVFDSTPVASNVLNVAISPPPDVARGGACDGNIALDRCARGTLCLYDDVLAENRCRAPRVDCGEDVPVIDLNALRAGVGVWRAEDTTFDGIFDRIFNSCAADNAGVEVIRFTAPAADTYRVAFEADFNGLLFARSYCNVGQLEFERLCLPDRMAEGVVELEADEAIFFLVGGHAADREADEAAYKNSRGTYRLTVSRGN